MNRPANNGRGASVRIGGGPFESDYKEIMRAIESIKGNWFAILNKRENGVDTLTFHHH